MADSPLPHHHRRACVRTLAIARPDLTPLLRGLAFAAAALVAAGLLAACGSPAGAPVASAPAAAAPAAEVAAPAASALPVTAAAPDAAAQDAAAEASDWLQTASIEGDRFVLGNPAAAVRLLDYSDFL
jgi:hypothetical protein